MIGRAWLVLALLASSCLTSGDLGELERRWELQDAARQAELERRWTEEQADDETRARELAADLERRQAERKAELEQLAREREGEFLTATEGGVAGLLSLAGMYALREWTRRRTIAKLGESKPS